jgi:hypothetical protein
MSRPDAERPDARPLACGRCGVSVTLGRGECYLVEIRAVADPSPPVFTGDDFSRDAEAEIAALLRRLHGLTEEQLMGEVYRRKLLCLCNTCYSEWIEAPASRAST